MNWTEQQRQAIEERGKNLLVAAAAGSGKTAVLVERIKRLILEDGCPIDRMLIVTFTNAAASEMKEKIRRAVSQSIGELARQLSEAQQHSEAQQLSAAEKRSGIAEELQALEEKLNFLKQQMNTAKASTDMTADRHSVPSTMSQMPLKRKNNFFPVEKPSSPQKPDASESARE